MRLTATWRYQAGSIRPQPDALMTAARNHEIDCVLVWKFDRFARSTRHLLTALEEFNHLGSALVEGPGSWTPIVLTGRAMFTIIGSHGRTGVLPISERVTAE